MNKYFTLQHNLCFAKKKTKSHTENSRGIHRTVVTCCRCFIKHRASIVRETGNIRRNVSNLALTNTNLHLIIEVMLIR